MGMPKSSLLLLMLLLAAISNSQISRFTQARPLPFLPQEKYSKIFATLGVVCKCCNGVRGTESECARTWTGSCHDLQCLPWKLDH